MGLELFFIGVDMALLDKMDPQRAKSAPGAIELNRHFGAETDLFNLQCILENNKQKQVNWTSGISLTWL